MGQYLYTMGGSGYMTLVCSALTNEQKESIGNALKQPYQAELKENIWIWHKSEEYNMAGIEIFNRHANMFSKKDGEDHLHLGFFMYNNTYLKIGSIINYE